MDISKLLAAYLISQGAHTGGHFYEAGNQGIPAKMDAKHLAETWTVPVDWNDPDLVAKSPYRDLILSNEDLRKDANRKKASIRGAGFAMQDRARDLIDDPKTKKDVAAMSALIKGFYLAGGPVKLSKDLAKVGGDIEGMERASGNRHVKELVAASILGDYFKMQNPKGNLSYSFDVIDGAPGGRINYRW